MAEILSSTNRLDQPPAAGVNCRAAMTSESTAVPSRNRGPARTCPIRVSATEAEPGVCHGPSSCSTMTKESLARAAGASVRYLRLTRARRGRQNKFTATGAPRPRPGCACAVHTRAVTVAESSEAAGRDWKVGRGGAGARLGPGWH